MGIGWGGRASAGTAPIRGERSGHLSPWGYLLFTAWATAATILLEGWWLAGLGLAEIAFGLVWSRKPLRLLRRFRFWAFVLTAVLIGPLLLGEPDVAWGPLRLSRAGLVMGLAMAGRAFTLTLAFSLGLSALSLSDVVAVFGRLRLRGLGFALALAMNSLETLRGMALVTLQTLRLRGAARRPWTALRLFLVTTIANTLRYGDELVNAAAVRAFDPNARRSAPLPLRQADLWLAVVLMVCSGLLLVQW